MAPNRAPPATLVAVGKARATVRKAYQILSGIFSQAVDDGRLPKSPLPRRPGLRPVERTDMTILTLPQVHDLAATIDQALRFHDLRHTHASVLIAQGEHPKVISERLGHASIRTTFDVYGHLMPGMDEEVA